MKILVRGTNWIGDAVMSIPALRELRRIFPEDQITLLTRSWADGLFQDASFIDEIVSYDKAKWPVRDILDNSKFLKRDNFDLAVLLPNSFESAITAFLTKIPRRIGYNKDVRGLLLTDPIAVPEWKDRRHEAYYYVNLVQNVERLLLNRETVGRFEYDGKLEVSDERKSAARKFLIENGIDFGRPTVALGVGSANSRAKRWPVENYAKLAEMIANDANQNVVLIGSKDEESTAAEVEAHCKVKLVNVAGKTDLAMAAAILARSDLMISNDMGLAHLAPAVGTRTIVLFGPTNPETTRPFSPNAFVLREPVDCAPCMLRDCPIDHRCMTRITPERVFEAAFAANGGDEDEQ
ncbi:MAG TPA: lipopolysaccharide heptosyltransferase II [Pyrinomonadaceae bacterium]|nr:lipopolysaccharide heptosyltransferase II [Pyrinomonadaceae bacterium]